MASTIGKLLVELGLDDTNFKGGVKSATAALEQLQQTSLMFGGALDKAVTGALAAAGAAMAAFGVATVKTGIDFEQAITNVGAIANASDNDLERLTDRARELGASTKFTATEAADAMKFLAQAGMSVNEVLASTGPAMLFAGGAGTDMATATALTAATLSQFQLDATQAGRVSDVFSIALRKSLFEVDSLREAMKYGGTVGAGFGYALEETTAALAMFRNLGLEGSMAGTNFRMSMAAAANATDESRKVLAKYGLTAEDINPELHSFAEIMETVGKAAMTTTDMLEVFGLRSGANIANIARQFADGTTEYYTLLDAMKNGAGEAEALYGSMTNTVQGRLDIALSAFQELMLSLFDTMKGPMADLLDEVANTIAYVAQVFNREAGTIGRSFEDMVGRAVAYLRDNRAMIATTFIDFIKSVRGATETLARLLPVLLQISKVMIVVWAADRVRVFVASLSSAASAIGVVSGSVRTLMLSLTAASGGIYAVVAAVGTLIAGLVYFATVSREAEAATERLRAAEEKLAVEQEARANKQRQAAAELAAQQALRMGNLELLLQTENTLNVSLEQQIQRLQGLDSATIQAGLSSGQLFTATMNGTKVVLDHATALQLQYDGTSQADAAAASFKTTQMDAQRELANSKRQLDKLNIAINDYDTFVEAGGNETVAYKGVLSTFGATVEEVRKRQEDLGQQVKDAQAKIEGLAQGAELAAQALAKKEIAAELAAKKTAMMGDVDEQSARQARDASEEWRRAYEARVRAVQKAEDDIARRRAKASEQAAIELRLQLEELNRLFDAEVLAYGKQTDKIRAAELERARIVAVVRADAARQQQEEQEAVLKQLREALAAAGRDEADREAFELQSRINTRREALRLEFEQELALYERGATERLDVLLRFMQARTKLEEVEAAEAQQRVRDTYTRINQIIEQLQLSDAEAQMNELQRIELERLRTLVESANATGRQVAEINAVYDQRVLNQKRALSEEVRMLTAGDYRRVYELEKERDQLLSRLAEDQLAEREAVIAYYNAAIADALAKAEEGVDTFGDVAKQVMENVRAAAVDVARAIGIGIGKAAMGVLTLFEELTGFSFSLSDAMEKAKKGMEEVAALQEQLAAGEISVDEYEEKLAALPMTAVAGAEAYVTELVNGASELLATFVEAAPAALEALANQLPSLLQQFADALPMLASTLAQAAGQLASAIIAELPAIIGALADSVVLLVQALIEDLPLIVDQLVASLQAALPSLLRAVLAVVDLVPVLVGAVARALPQLVQALMQVLQALVPALVDAAIGVVGAVVLELPRIIQALTAGALQLVAMLIAEVPRLVLAVVDMLPAIVAGLMQAATMLILELVRQLPSIIENLLMATTDIVVGIIAMLPRLIAAIIIMLPDLIVAVVRLIPAIILGIARALPQIVTAVINLIPTFIVAFITQFVPAFIKALPVILYEVTVGLLLAIGQALGYLARGIGEAIVLGLQKLVQFFRDVLAEIFTLGKAETATFGDTPGAVKAGAEGMAARFAPGDYIIAAQRPADLLQQALDAMRGQLANGLAPAARGYLPGEVEVPAAAGLASAMLQAATAMQGAAGGGGGGMGGQRVQVVVQANGRTLDEVLFTAGQRGEAPRLQRELRRTTLRAGVHVGFDRGKF
jgi:TP901 family phage tail tape measure protein